MWCILSNGDLYRGSPAERCRSDHVETISGFHCVLSLAGLDDVLALPLLHERHSTDVIYDLMLRTV